MHQAFLRSIIEAPDDDTPRLAYSDWLQDRGERPAGLLVLERALARVARCPVTDLSSAALDALMAGGVREAGKALARALPGRPRWSDDLGKSLVHVEEHLAQLCLHVGRHYGETDVYHRWIFFDDLWAGAHPDLANAILRYARTWDVLSPGRPSED